MAAYIRQCWYAFTPIIRLQYKKYTKLAQSKESILKGYWPIGAKGAILITSRKYYNFIKDKQRKGDTVKPFNEQQSFDLLMLLLGEQWQSRTTRLLRQAEITAAKTLLKKTRRPRAGYSTGCYIDQQSRDRWFNNSRGFGAIQ